MTEQMNVPKLRFGELNNDWKEVLLDDVAIRGSGHTPNKKIPSYYDGDIKWVSLADSKRLDNGLIDKTENTISLEGIKNSSAVLHPAGSVLLSRDAGVGKSAVMKEDMAVSQHFMVWNGIEHQLDNWFLYYKLQILKPVFEKIAVGSTIKTIGLPFFKKLKIIIPNIKEQQKIASFLSKVDEKIGLLSEKKDKLIEYKRGVMQQLFNGKWHEQDGQLTFVPPTLRFKADDGSEFPDWEEKTLIELTAQGLSNGVFNDPKRIGKGYRLINVKDMYSGNFIDTSTLSLLDLSEKEFSKNQVKYGDIFFTRSSLVPSGIAYSNVNLSNDDDITYDGHLIKFSPNLDMMSPYYFANYLRSYSSRKSLISRGKQSTMTTIGQEDIKDISFFIPSLDEQTKIADLLVALDQKIDFTSSELENAKEWKKGLLQQMFV